MTKKSSNNNVASGNDLTRPIANTSPKKVIVAGGYGVFGRWICEELADDSSKGLLELVIAGRNPIKAKELASELTNSRPQASITPQALNIHDPLALQQQLADAFLLINCCGPFQNRDYSVAKACIASGTHYIDLADSRNFVTGISALDQAAQSANVSVVSGASSVPGLSSAVLKELCADMEVVESIDIAIAPGNKAPRGEATVHSILLSTGQPIPYWKNGRWQPRLGWFNHRRIHFGRAGHRWIANVDIPDLSLLPEHYPTAKSVTFQAGLELKLLHFGLFFIAVVARLIRRPFGFAAGPLTRIARWFESWGSDVGAMKVSATGFNSNNQSIGREWLLTAGSGDGPRIPTIASVILCRKLLGENQLAPPSGAMPCLELFTEEEFRETVKHLDIDCTFSSCTPE